MSHTCRVCGHGTCTTIFSHPDTPLFIGILGPSVPRGIANVRLPIALVRCERCGTVQQPAEPRVDELLDTIYRASRDNACSGTRTGEGEFGRQRAETFLGSVDLLEMPPRVLEIGCNEGHMLRICQERGAQTLVGVEPSMDAETSPAPGITILPGYFDATRLGDRRFDLAYLIEVLEHIPEPVDLLRDVHHVLDAEGRIAISVPNCESGLEFGNIGMPIHEHLLYFTPESLAGALRRASFEVVRMTATFSHLYCLAKKASGAAEPSEASPAPAESFWPACVERLERVARFAADRREPWGLYGACSLTANLLAWLPGIDLTHCSVIDADPNKRGRIVSGCPSPTLSPDDAVAAGIRDVVVMPFGFQENIAGFLRDRYPTLQPTLLYRGLAERYSARAA
jgi:SAM-dependent methyltransferase